MADGPQIKSGIKGDVKTALAHDSGHKHVAGSATYIDDLPEPPGMLHLYVALSEHAHANITTMDVEAVCTAPGVALVLSAADVPGTNDVSPHSGDDPMLAENLVQYAGQALFAVAAESVEQARAAAKLAHVTYEPLPAITTIKQARNAGLHLMQPQQMVLGDSASALEDATNRLQGSIYMGGQDHFYLEGQIAVATPEEDGDVHVFSSTQNPTEVQHVVGRVLDLPANAVTVEVRRMGGGFGGKETHSNQIAALAALVAVKTGRAAKLRLDRDDDMVLTGKRHDFDVTYDVGFDDTGRIEGIEIDLASRCGYSMDLSLPINDRAMFHSDNCYFLPNVTIRSARYKTHTVSNTAFRGFGGPQGMVGIERVMDAIAAHLGKDPLAVRKANFYGEGRSTTPYHQEVEDFVADEIIAELEASSDYAARRSAIREFNEQSPYLKKGIALTPVKFGISFTLTHMNQAGALLHIYSDGSVHLNHGGTEMGQGLFTKVAQVVAREFQIDIDRIKITATTTGKVPNTSPTAASSGSDLNGMAALAAARTLKSRLVEFAAEHFDCPEDSVRFDGNQIFAGNNVLSFDELAQLAYLNRVPLSSTGFYKTPEIFYDRDRHQGRPFYYFAYGAAVSEVIIDTFTGENRVVRTDILHETGESLNPALDLGQIEGGFIQGMGWLTTEELVFDDAGHLRTHAPSTYKIPTAGDRPEVFNMTLWEKGSNREATIHRSKAVGEPPFMLGISVLSALTDAVASVGEFKVMPDLNAPATPEEVLRAVDAVRAAAQ